MAITKLKTLLDDVKFSFKFANLHVREGVTATMRNHSMRHRRDIERIRSTDEQASGLAAFRDSIDRQRVNPKGEQTGHGDYQQMVDILIRRGGLLDHYAGPRELKDWAEARDLKGQFTTLIREAKQLNAGSTKEAWDVLNDNKALNGALSVARTALHSATSEIKATGHEELTPVVLDAVITTIVNELNLASVEALGHEVTVESFKQYLAEVGDGMGERPELRL